MPFNESSSGADRAAYNAGVVHVATGLPITLTINSLEADGAISESDCDQILQDIASIIATDPRFQSTFIERVRQARDSWAPPQ